MSASNNRKKPRDHQKPQQPLQMSEQDIADLQALQDEAEAAPKYTLLETWSIVLENIEKSKVEQIPIVVANKIAAAWTRLSFADVQKYHERYHDILILGRDRMLELIRQNPGCFKNLGERGTETADAFANRAIYIELMYQWQLLFLELEHNWVTTQPDAAIELAAIADAAQFLTGEQGLVAHLGLPQVNFQYGPEDQAELQARLEAARAEL